MKKNLLKYNLKIGSIALAFATFQCLHAQVTTCFSVAPGSPATGGNYIPSSVPADLNNDGNKDVVVANYSSKTIGVFLGTGTGSLLPMVSYTLGASPAPNCIAIGDVNNDGNKDVISSNQISNNIAVLMGSPSGTLSAPVFYSLSGTPLTVALAHMDGDANLDIVCGSSANYAVLKGSLTGTFSPATYYPSSVFALASLKLVDVNNDAFKDVVGCISNNVSICFGSVTGTLSSATVYTNSGTSNAAAIDAKDLNGDGFPDLAIARGGTTGIAVMMGSASGTFATTSNYTTFTSSDAISLNDLNGDNYADVVVAGQFSTRIFFNDGSGNFTPAGTQSVPGSAYWVSTDDMNNDGKIDIISSAGTNTLNVNILLNKYTPATIVATPSVLCVGSSAILSSNGATTYTWNTLATTNSISVSPTVTTTYSVAATNSVGCANFAKYTLTVSACTGLNNNNKDDKDAMFSIYPNPSNGYLQIESVEESEISIVDVFGKVVYNGAIQKGKSNLNLSEYKAGIYFIIMGDVQGQRTKKLIIEK